MARDREHTDIRFPTPEEVLGEICGICHGTTWVVRANVELDGPIMAQLEPCDNPLCPQMKQFGQREIIHLAVPHNNFTQVVSLPQGKITAIRSDD
jgi:hypothetical protein